MQIKYQYPSHDSPRALHAYTNSSPLVAPLVSLLPLVVPLAPGMGSAEGLIAVERVLDRCYAKGEKRAKRRSAGIYLWKDSDDVTQKFGLSEANTRYNKDARFRSYSVGLGSPISTEIFFIMLLGLPKSVLVQSTTLRESTFAVRWPLF